MAFLEVENMSLQFGGVKACQNVNMRLEPGILYGLIGPNGAGKSTIFNVLTGIYAPTTGDVRLGGQSLVGKKPYEIAQMGIGRTFQNIRLFKELSVLENVMTSFYSSSETSIRDMIFQNKKFKQEEEEIRMKSMELLDVMGIKDLAEVPAGGLPYGKQRKLEIARALGLNPKLLLLDEPAAGLNPAETRELTTLIRDIQKQRHITVLLIEHDMGLVMKICEKIYVLVQGQLVCEGVAEVVQNDKRVIEAYLGVD
ncbi:ABC transporter ATP-binding protein [Peredibacter starrii]|uniref:ABC transporter ATP-binding protein n=1 Tax=Peredibacter starrii TaxID=28202 RepID=A0AAX4HK23_9BACT|nr:ABC transporter ATP-binding protein [Peredibacter starrii]WPU63606.1 ABC transporter ATP-binding protein [Peredibacter starrii]